MKTFWIKSALLAAAVVIVAGCGSVMNQNRTMRYSGSLYSYLNTNVTGGVHPAAVSSVAGPFKVGIGFVPANYSPPPTNSFEKPLMPPGDFFPASDQKLLLERVAEQFKPYPFVKSVEILQPCYFSPAGGFANLEQIRATFGLDAIVLLACDQVQYSDEGALALSYWTIVGAYFVQGERNETKTVMELVAYDIGSRQLLFRADGVSVIKGSATPVNLSEQLRNDSQQGFNAALTKLIPELKAALDRFGKRLEK